MDDPTSTPMTAARAALLDLLRRRAYRRGSFVLASGKTSDFFIDCKQATMCAEGLALVSNALYEAARRGVGLAEAGVDLLDAVRGVAGVALGGCPLATALAFAANARGERLDLFYVRKEPKDHGTMRRVEGPEPSGDRAVLLVEDVVTTGGSSVAALAALREAGLRPVGVLALVDRLEGGRTAIEATGVPFVALFDRSHFVG